MGRTKDENIRQRIHDITNHGSIPMTSETLFKALGLDYKNRDDYAMVMHIISSDRDEFYNGVWNPTRQDTIEPTYETYKTVYKYCIKDFVGRNNRILLYKFPEGWRTPLTFDEFIQCEQFITQALAKSIVNKRNKLISVSYKLPYDIEISQLENHLTKIDEISKINFVIYPFKISKEEMVS